MMKDKSVDDEEILVKNKGIHTDEGTGTEYYTLAKGWSFMN